MGIFGKQKQHAQMMATQYLKIVNDCAKLVNSTVNPGVFFSRYDLMVENLTKLSQIEYLLKFTGKKPSTQLNEIVSRRDYETSLFIARSFEKLMHDVEKLKTPKGKGNKISAYFTNMSEYSRYLSNKNIEALQKMKSFCEQKGYFLNAK